MKSLSKDLSTNLDMNAGDYICGYNEIDPDYIEDADLESEN